MRAGPRAEASDQERGMAISLAYALKAFIMDDRLDLEMSNKVLSPLAELKLHTTIQKESASANVAPDTLKGDDLVS